MNRFDDKFSWHLFEKVIAPLISVCLAWGAFRIQLEHRMTEVEVRESSLHEDVKAMQSDIKELLRRTR